jgi:hypothetical protein
MKKYILIVCFVLCVIKMFSQKESNEIRYYFNPRIDSILTIAIDSNLLNIPKYEDSLYFIIFHETDTLIQLTITTCPDKKIYNDSGKIINWIGYLMKNTNRNLQISGRKIPLILESDIYFGVVSVVNESQKIFTQVAFLNIEFRKKLRIIADSRKYMNNKVYKITY